MSEEDKGLKEGCIVPVAKEADGKSTAERGEEVTWCDSIWGGAERARQSGGDINSVGCTMGEAVASFTSSKDSAAEIFDMEAQGERGGAAEEGGVVDEAASSSTRLPTSTL